MEATDTLIKKWILGSSSKWRRNTFLKEFHSDLFAAADIDEKAIRHPDAEIMTQLIAKAKAEEIIRRGEVDLSDALLVCCDQVIRFQGEVREKPETREECRAFLKSYQQNPDEFVECINGLCLYFNGHFLSHYEISMLTFCKLTDAKIEELVKLDDLMTCAGGFTVCHMAIGRLKGSVYGVEGFPVKMVRGLGNLTAKLQTHGKIRHCVISITVLLNINDLYLESHEELCKKYNKELPSNAKLRVLGLDGDAVSQMVIDMLEFNITVDNYLQQLHSIIETKLSALKFLPGAESFLNQFEQHANVSKVMVSRLSPMLLESVKATPIGKRIMDIFKDNVICTDSLPSVDIYQIMVETARESSSSNEGVKLERILVFEDSSRSTREPFHAGMNVILVSNPNSPDVVIQDCSLHLNDLLYFDVNQFVS